ncbi:hypothetical protein JVX90_16945 [Gordonia sp. PDNC005]|uniref:hypothetical protein n=1 Tax=unclassified Gordonia (in: high G+C Gram-positive bacteria) TaxID=2657482 RepID=UPI001963DEEE|nr:hypothetical protein [Gordonia sp. PDNC005]QRY62064.1 hypothetical protein JVX90_16945 [Gordonia sp. PDNC005]
MCRPSRCRTCGKTTWAGCGSHIAQVKASVPADRWCAGTHTAQEKSAAKAASGGFFAKFRR